MRTTIQYIGERFISINNKFIHGSYGISGSHLFRGNDLRICNLNGDILWYKINDGIEGFVEIRRVYLIDLSEKENLDLNLFRYTCVINQGNYSIYES